MTDLEKQAREQSFCHDVKHGCCACIAYIGTSLYVSFAFCNLKRDRYVKRIARKIAVSRAENGDFIQVPMTEDEWLAIRKKVRANLHLRFYTLGHVKDLIPPRVVDDIQIILKDHRAAR